MVSICSLMALNTERLMRSGGHFICHDRWFGARRYRNKHVLLPLDQRGRIVAGHLETVAVRDGVGGAGLHAVAAKNTPVVIDIVDLGVALTARDAHFVRVLGSFYVNTIGRAGRGA